MISQVFLLLTLLPVIACFRAMNGKVQRTMVHVPQVNARLSSALFMGARNRAWAKGDLSDKDIFEGIDKSETDDKDSVKNKFKLDPEVVFYEGPPSISEVILPAISVLTVIGIVPFISALSRQAWVRYKFTSRRVSIQSGIGGSTQTQVIYPDIQEIKFVYRNFGAAGDMVMFLKDGAKVELRHVPDFENIYNFVLSKCDKECQERSMKTLSKPATSS